MGLAPLLRGLHGGKKLGRGVSDEAEIVDEEEDDDIDVARSPHRQISARR